MLLWKPALMIWIRQWQRSFTKDKHSSFNHLFCTFPPHLYTWQSFPTVLNINRWAVKNQQALIVQLRRWKHMPLVPLLYNVQLNKCRNKPESFRGIRASSNRNHDFWGGLICLLSGIVSITKVSAFPEWNNGMFIPAVQRVIFAQTSKVHLSCFFSFQNC